MWLRPAPGRPRAGRWNDAWVALLSGRDQVAAGLFELLDPGGNDASLRVVRRRKRGQRQAQPVAELHAREQCLERNRVGFDAEEVEDRLQAGVQCARIVGASAARKIAQATHRM